jgi:hypothetical protein
LTRYPVDVRAFALIALLAFLVRDRTTLTRHLAFASRIAEAIERPLLRLTYRGLGLRPRVISGFLG